MASAQPNRATVPSRKPVVAPAPERSESPVERLAPHFSAKAAPSRVPSSNTGREKNMPTSAPPEAPAMPHFDPPNKRVPKTVQAKSESTESSQNPAIQPTAHQLNVSGSNHFCSSTATSISVVPGNRGTTDPI